MHPSQWDGLSAGETQIIQQSYTVSRWVRNATAAETISASGKPRGTPTVTYCYAEVACLRCGAKRTFSQADTAIGINKLDEFVWYYQREHYADRECQIRKVTTSPAGLPSIAAVDTWCLLELVKSWRPDIATEAVEMQKRLVEQGLTPEIRLDIDVLMDRVQVPGGNRGQAASQ